MADGLRPTSVAPPAETEIPGERADEDLSGERADGDLPGERADEDRVAAGAFVVDEDGESYRSLADFAVYGTDVAPPNARELTGIYNAIADPVTEVMDQHNSFRARIEDGEAVYGARSSTFSPAVIELYGELGLDFVWLDFEHMGPSPYDSTVFENLTRAAEVGGTELLVRLPSGDPPLVRKVLDAGVRNLLVPRVDSATGLREAVEATRFVYDGEPGERGMASGRSRTWGLADDYVATEDEAVCIGTMIEKTTAVEELDEILSVPELGFVFVGPGDLSVQMGHPTDENHPEVRRRVEEIENACLSAGVPLGRIESDPAAVEAAVADGYRILRIGGDLGSIRSVLSDRLRRISDR